MYIKTAAALLALLGLLTHTTETNGAKILAVYAFPGKSHFMMHRVLISELLQHGHEVTMITGLTLDPHKMGKNYTEILIEPVFDFWKQIHEISGTNSIYDFDNTNDLSILLNMIQILGVATTEHALKQPNIQAVINAKETQGVYDLLLVEQFFQDAFLALAHIYNVPVISTATFAQQNFMSQMFGIISPWSYVPFGFMPLTDHMSYWERVQNTYYTLKFDLDRERNYFPEMDQLVDKYFGHLSIDFPTTSEMSRNLSAVLINNYAPLALPGPTIDNMINVGGMHIYPNKPLPNDLQKFLDEAEHGAIYFSLGTQVESKDLPPEKLQIFLDVFRHLKQRVLWKFENDSFPNLPKNVMIKSWMPQNDILAHPNVRVFIAHGGHFGTQEAVYYGVPIVGIPFYSDQYLNVKKSEIGGYGNAVNIHTMDQGKLEKALNEVLNNRTYRDNMRRMSKIFRDRPLGPRETAIYWIDYVIRHKGTRHLRAAGLDLKWYQFYLLDVIALFVAAAALSLCIGFMIIKWFWQKFEGGKSKQKVQ